MNKRIERFIIPRNYTGVIREMIIIYLLAK
jgi:hypothetical protein